MGENRRDFYVKELQRKQRSLAAVQNDLETCQSQEQELSLKGRAEQLLREIDDLEKELSEVDLASEKPIIKARKLEQTLKKIDFLEARRIASDLNSMFEAQDGGSALLLLQRTTRQKGDYCLYEMLRLIFEYEMEELILRGKKNESCKVYVADLFNVAREGIVSESECLKQLLNYEGESISSDDLATLGQAFRKSLCDSLRSGDRVLILIKDWHYVEPKSFLSWFIKEFWKPLVNEIQSCVLPEYGRIKVIAVLASSSQILPDCLSDTPLCSLDSFNPHQLIEIPLPDWTIDDLQKWFMDVKKLGRSDSRRLAHQLHAETEGTPQVICTTLMERYSA